MTISLLILAAVLSVMIGLVLGMLGGGGAILMVPMLVYALGIAPKAAIATSLVVVGTTSLVAAVAHARSSSSSSSSSTSSSSSSSSSVGGIRWKVGLLFASSAMIFAFAGGKLAQLIPATALLVVFAAAMLATAFAMLRPRRREESNENTVERAPRIAVAAILAVGAAVGLLSGLVGAGGGFLIVPALTLFGGLAMREAIGTSLFIIGLQSLAGFASHARYVELDWHLIAVVASAALTGSVVGAQLGKVASPATLRRAFGVLAMAMGIFVIGKQLY